MKQLLFRRFVASLLFFAVSSLSWAYDFTINGIYYDKNTDDTSVTVTYRYKSFNPYTGDFDVTPSYSGSVVIPSTVTYDGKTYDVTSIGSSAFSGCSDLTSVTIPNSVTSIGEDAFYRCRSLTSITIPNSVTSIGNSAFYYCSSLTSVTIPNSITSINGYAFCGTGLTSVTIPNSVTNIGYCAFSACSGLTSITIPNSVTSIGGHAFNSCRGLTSVTIPNSVTSIGESAFSGCSGLTSVTIPNSVTSIGEGAFGYCSGLTSVTIPNSVTSIGSSAFNGTAWYDNQPDGLVYAGMVAYEYKGTMPEGTHITIKEGTLGIAGSAFYGCSGLTSVTIPNSVTSIGESAFRGCSGLTSVTIPNCVTSLGFGAFYGCRGLTSVTIPNSVTSIGNSAFYYCSGLTSMYCHAEIIPSTGSNTFRNSSVASATLYVPASAVNSYKSTTPWSSFGKIQQFYYDFEYDNIYYKINEDGITVSITSRDSDSYNSYSGSVVIPSTIKYNNKIYSVTNIGERAFYNCSSLTALTIPNSITSIGNDAFSNCRNLTSIKVEAGNPKYDSRDNCNAIIETATNSLISGCKNTVIPNSVTSIGDRAFYGCAGLTSITIPNSVTSIGGNAFYNCSGLTSIKVEDGNPKYDSRDNCNAIIETATNSLISGCKNTVIPNSVTCIGEYAFKNCSGLTSITIPNSVTSIGSSAFEGTAWYDNQLDGLIYAGKVAYKYKGTMPSGTNITLDQGTLGIAGSAFYNCSGLTSVTIPGSVTSIGSQAFSGCSSLTSMYCYAEIIPSTGSDAFQNSNVASATLYVPASAVNSYKSTTPWSSFGKIQQFYYDFESDNIYYKINEDGVTVSITSRDSDSYNSYSGSVEIPSTIKHKNKVYSVTSIGVGAFASSSGLTSVTIPNSVTSIEDAAFEGCTGLTSVTIPGSVTSIGEEAFEKCRSMTSLIIEDGVISIDKEAFSKCSALTSVVIPKSVASMGKSTFNGCTSLTSITLNTNNVVSTNFTSDKNLNTILGCQVKEIILGDEIKSIGNYAFFNCSSLTSIDIPESVTNIGANALYGTAWYNNQPDGLVYAGKVAYKYKGTLPAGTDIAIVDGTLGIGGSAFQGCIGLTSITFPNSLVCIGDYSFSGCTGLESVTLPNSVTSIGNDAFPTTTKIYVDKGVLPLIALWNSGLNPYDLSTNTCLTPPYDYRLHSFASSIGLINNAPTNLIKIENESLTIDGVTKTGQNASITGLSPNTDYPVQYNATITYVDGSSTYTATGNITTEALTLTTSQPKVISLGNAVVGAISNLDDAEKNVGFEWRRIDWTEDFASNTGVAYLYEGTMEGYIRNLYIEKLWKVRPYYRDNTGQYYYGDWVGLDPTNTSYYEPTVHTYARIDQTENKVQISGYVQRGTDTVSKQGFKYWIQENNGNARGAGISIPSGAKTVEAEGRVMEVELTGLKPNTTYAYVAFVTTTEGETFYGKQLSFTTGDDPEASITGDANGNGEVEIGDVTSVLTLMATPEATGYNNKAADANGNGVIEIGDVTTILTIMAGN